jgi:uncharacterized protein (TIGR00369 family)
MDNIDLKLPEAANPPEGFVPISHTNPFGAGIGPIYEREAIYEHGESGTFVRGLFVRPELSNSAGIAHGGVLMTFADIVLARGVMQQIGGMAVTVRMVSDFMAPVLVGAWLEGRADVSKVTRSLAFVSGELSVKGKVVFTAQATFKPLK